MKGYVIDIAEKMSRLSASELDELTTVLMHKHDLSATIYRLIPITKNLECDLWLVKVGDRKLQMIKTVKDAFGLGLRDAKTIIDNAPCFLKEFMPTHEAEKIQETLESIGATVEIRYHDN